MVRRAKALDYIIIALLSTITMLSFFSIEKEESILINADGKEYRYPADTEETIEVEGPLGTTTIRIEDGKARIIDSPCPNKTCLNESIGNTITCLPNRVMIVNPEKKGREEDTVAY